MSKRATYSLVSILRKFSHSSQRQKPPCIARTRAAVEPWRMWPSEAQFTPKYVETANEREKLMYRIKLHIDPRVIETYRGYVKAGFTGNAYVKIQAAANWPADLAPRLPDAP
jgi:hypothetical protein